jgi:hypothetical protein
MARKWIRNSAWKRQPHVKDGPPPSLWWFRRPDRHRIIDAYINQCKRGRALPEGFKDDLVKCLQDLSKYQNLKDWGKARTYRYWSAPAYALAHPPLKSAALMKRLRELEKIAIQLFRDDVPASRKPRAPLTEEEIQEIQKRCLDGDNIKDLAQEFRVTASKVGHLCREQKAIRNAARQKAESETAPTSPPPDEMPF